MLRLIKNMRAEVAEFRAALAEAPDPQLRWDVFGARSLIYRAWWRLLREHAEPRELGWAVFAGVMVGLSPLYGTHVLMALGLAMAFRLNKLAVWLATNVSFPVFSPFFAYVSCQLGHLVLKGELMELGLGGFRERAGWELARELFVYWMVGFPVQGLFVGGLLGWITYSVARRRKSADR